MTGVEIKQLIISNKVKCWQVAEALGMNDGNFSRRLRKPFSDTETARVKKIIHELSEAKTNN